MSSDKSNLPSDIILARERRLAELASQYRMQSDNQESVIAEYGQVLTDLLQFEGWSGEPDIDSQLPLELMPESYFNYWDKRSGTIQSIVRSELVRSKAVQIIDAESFLNDLATVIHAAKFGLSLPSADESNRIPKVCRQLAMMGIFLHNQITGDGSNEAIWRICKRILSVAGIRLDDEGKEEFAGKLAVTGVTDVDLRETLERHCVEDGDATTQNKIAEQLGFGD